jgi:hypothetical protein
MKKIKHKDLLKISRPVLLFLEEGNEDQWSKLRILYPDGRCEYRFLCGPSHRTEWYQSCFQGSTLAFTIEGMIEWEASLGGTVFN